jgi:hypothetical protein
MTTAQPTLPTSEKVRFIYLRKWPNVGDMIYLQGVRSGQMKEDSLAAQTYKGKARIYAGKLADIVMEDKVPAFDAVVSPPSKRSDADVYRNELITRADLRDLTARFSRNGQIRAAAASTVEEVRDEFTRAAVDTPSCVDLGGSMYLFRARPRTAHDTDIPPSPFNSAAAIGSRRRGVLRTVYHRPRLD